MASLPEKPRQFQVGDRVRVISTTNSFENEDTRLIGVTGIIKSIILDTPWEDGEQRVIDIDDLYWWHPKDLKLVEVAVP